MTKITIAIPTNRGVRPKTMESVMRLIANNAYGEYEFHCICPSEGYTIAENRNYIVAQALQHESDYLLMIDDDMVFESDLLDRLIANDKAICGVAYHSRGSTDKIKIVPDDVMAISEVDKGKYINLTTETDPKYKELFECYAVGTGIILIKTSVFTQIPRPWFEFTFDESGKCKEGEDWNFCFKAKDKGFKIYTDPTVFVGHIGETIY